MGGSGFCARARARRATSRLRANRVLHARAACNLEMGGSGFLRARARAPARHPGYGRTGYCTRGHPATLSWADPVLPRARARRATSRLRANRVLHARAACNLEMGGSGFCARARARRATSRSRANRVLHARASCNLELGGSGFCARRARARAARHPGYGRTGYCTRGPPATLRWADPVLRARARARRATSGYGRTGYCTRGHPATLSWADPVFARARACAARHTRLCP